ncbi:PPOX class F420-dependent oxidoreductase [Actinokineospora sp. HUAS TT18]|uniref:PPOX class F420-dependent oxidoreductase n=1 Tax=Actinokineospora sp. HUAS TT18 TaxID=3447451 RepID=UPI003F5257F4
MTVTDEFVAFWQERHLCTLTTVRPTGTPHVVPVGATLDLDAGVARVITSGGSAKVRHIRSLGTAPAALCQLDGRRWSTVEGVARVLDDPESVADAVRRYTERYKPPRPNPERVVIEIAIQRVLGTVR